MDCITCILNPTRGHCAVGTRTARVGTPRGGVASYENVRLNRRRPKTIMDDLDETDADSRVNSYYCTSRPDYSMMTLFNSLSLLRPRAGRVRGSRKARLRIVWGRTEQLKDNSRGSFGVNDFP